MLNINIKNLSKYKYVYRIYIKESIIHHQIFPVVYANQNYLYFEENKKEQLSMIELKRKCYSYNCYSDIDLLYDDMIKENYSNYYLISEHKIGFNDVNICDMIDKIKAKQKKQKQDEINEQIKELNKKIKDLQKQLD